MIPLSKNESHTFNLSNSLNFYRDLPLNPKPHSCSDMGAKNGLKEEPESSDDEVPLASRKRKKLVAKEEPQSDGEESEAAVNGNSEDDPDYNESEDDVPLSRRKVSDSDLVFLITSLLI